MALGKSGITQLLTNIDSINDCLKYGNYETSIESVYSCWNTYQYVANNLKEWADDTTIGAETKQNLLKLSNILSQLIEETRNVQNKVSNFCDSQDKINGTKSSVKLKNCPICGSTTHTIHNVWGIYPE